MNLRQKVVDMSREEEDCPYDQNLVQGRFLHSLATGLRNNSVRSELRPIFRQLTISAEELLQKLTLAV